MRSVFDKNLAAFFGSPILSFSEKVSVVLPLVSFQPSVRPNVAEASEVLANADLPISTIDPGIVTSCKLLQPLNAILLMP